MARPMLLMEEAILKELYSKYSQGVPVLKLIRQYKLDLLITAPTLTKLLSYIDAANKTNDITIRNTILASLFPTWLKERYTLNRKLIAMPNPNTWFYTGKMPLGQWKKRTLDQ